MNLCSDTDVLRGKGTDDCCTGKGVDLSIGERVGRYNGKDLALALPKTSLAKNSSINEQK